MVLSSSPLLEACIKDSKLTGSVAWASLLVRRRMRIRNRAVLKTIFTLQGNLRTAIQPRRRMFQGLEIAPLKHDAQAAACIAADFEMSWAFRHRSPEEARERGRQERENVPYILRLLEDYACPITWATVGHLFLE